MLGHGTGVLGAVFRLVAGGGRGLILMLMWDASGSQGVGRTLVASVETFEDRVFEIPTVLDSASLRHASTYADILETQASHVNWI